MHENIEESAYRIIHRITSIASKCKGPKAQSVLNKGLVNPLSNEIREQVDEDVDLAWALLEDHKALRPLKEWKRSEDPEE